MILLMKPNGSREYRENLTVEQIREIVGRPSFSQAVPGAKLRRYVCGEPPKPGESIPINLLASGALGRELYGVVVVFDIRDLVSA